LSGEAPSGIVLPMHRGHRIDGQTGSGLLTLALLLPR
jgi:hypothetical protein